MVQFQNDYINLKVFIKLPINELQLVCSNGCLPVEKLVGLSI